MGEIKQTRTTQDASGVAGLASLPAIWGKLDNALLSEKLNLSISKISGIICAVGICLITRSQHNSRI